MENIRNAKILGKIEIPEEEDRLEDRAIVWEKTCEIQAWRETSPEIKQDGRSLVKISASDKSTKRQRKRRWSLKPLHGIPALAMDIILQDVRVPVKMEIGSYSCLELLLFFDYL